MLLFTILSLLIVTIVIILVGSYFKLPQVSVHRISLFTTILCFGLSMFFFILFDRSSAEYQFVLLHVATTSQNGFVEFPQGFFYFIHQFFMSFGLDGISLFFVLLSTFIMPLCLLTSYKQGLVRVKEYCLVLITIELFLLCSFTALDLITFFFFFWKHTNPNVFLNWYLRFAWTKNSCFFFIFFVYFIWINFFFFFHIAFILWYRKYQF